MEKPSFIKRVAAGLSLLLLTNTVLAYTPACRELDSQRIGHSAGRPETNFWKERQESLQLASLPTMSSFPNVSMVRLAALAHHEAVVTPNHPEPGRRVGNPVSLEKSLTTLDPRLRISGMTAGFRISDLEFLADVPASLGTIRKVDSPPDLSPIASATGEAPRRSRSELWGAKGGRVLIHIQDVHLNQEAQSNIGKTIQALIDTGKVDLVALEGAFAPIDLQRFRHFEDQDAVHKVADYLLRENRISGPVHAAFVTSELSGKKFPRFIGVDDRVHYNANVDAYRRSAAVAGKTKKAIGHLEKSLSEEKTRVFNADLAALDDSIQAYRKGTLSLGDYLKILSDLTQDSKFTTHSLAVDIFQQAASMERTLNFSQVEAERTRLINDLVKKLSTKEIERLTQTALAYRSGQINHSEFYSALKKSCEDHGIRLARFPAMNSYLHYVLLSESIDAEKLLAETQQLEESCLTQLIRSPKEKNLAEQSRTLFLAEKLVNFELTKEEWMEYKTLKSSFPNVSIGNPVSYKLKDAGSPITYFGDDGLTSFEKFYTEAEARDKAMSENLLKAMDATNAKIAVLVTGGFHSAGIQKFLQLSSSNASVEDPASSKTPDSRLKISGMTTYVSFVPKLTKIEDASGSAYLSVFAQEKTPLDKLFAGEKLFLPPLVFPGVDVPAALVVLQQEVNDPQNELVPAAARQDIAALTGGPVPASVRTHDLPEEGAAELIAPNGRMVLRPSSDGTIKDANLRQFTVALSPKYLDPKLSGKANLKLIIATLGTAMILGGGYWLIYNSMNQKQAEEIEAALRVVRQTPTNSVGEIHTHFVETRDYKDMLRMMEKIKQLRQKFEQGEGSDDIGNELNAAYNALIFMMLGRLTEQDDYRYNYPNIKRLLGNVPQEGLNAYKDFRKIRDFQIAVKTILPRVSKRIEKEDPEKSRTLNALLSPKELIERLKIEQLQPYPKPKRQNTPVIEPIQSPTNSPIDQIRPSTNSPLLNYTPPPPVLGAILVSKEIISISLRASQPSSKKADTIDCILKTKPLNIGVGFLFPQKITSDLATLESSFLNPDIPDHIRAQAKRLTKKEKLSIKLKETEEHLRAIAEQRLDLVFPIRHQKDVDEVKLVLEGDQKTREGRTVRSARFLIDTDGSSSAPVLELQLNRIKGPIVTSERVTGKPFAAGDFPLADLKSHLPADLQRNLGNVVVVLMKGMRLNKTDCEKQPDLKMVRSYSIQQILEGISILSRKMELGIKAIIQALRDA